MNVSYFIPRTSYYCLLLPCINMSVLFCTYQPISRKVSLCGSSFEGLNIIQHWRWSVILSLCSLTNCFSVYIFGTWWSLISHFKLVLTFIYMHVNWNENLFSSPVFRPCNSEVSSDGRFNLEGKFSVTVMVSVELFDLLYIRKLFELFI
jgi:hypothetical protein